MYCVYMYCVCYSIKAYLVTNEDKTSKKQRPLSTRRLITS